MDHMLKSLKHLFSYFKAYEISLIIYKSNTKLIKSSFKLYIKDKKIYVVYFNYFLAFMRTMTAVLWSVFNVIRRR